MMPAIFVLDVPEFRPMVDYAREAAGFRVSGPAKGYFRLQSEGTLTLTRKTLGFKPAVWHGALTGGLIGRIERFDNEVLVLVEGGRP
jgi:hypothetical protein